MGDALIHGQLDALGVHHQEAHLFRGGLEEDAEDHGVEADALAAARSPGDEEVGHLGQVGDHRGAHDVFAQGQGQAGGGLLIGPLRQNLSEGHHLALGVGHLDAQDPLAGHRRHDADGQGLQGQGQVVGQPSDLADLDPQGGSYSKRLTTGPVMMAVTRPSTPKWRRVSSSLWAWASMAFSCTWWFQGGDGSRRSRLGRV